jgi:uncharacterized protein (DUF305 family)
MKNKFLAITAVAVVFLVGVTMSDRSTSLIRVEAAPLAASSNSCDRACLKNMVDQYIAAMVKHDPSGLPVAADYKFTENTAAIQIGDGLWVGASESPGIFKI